MTAGERKEKERKESLLQTTRILFLRCHSLLCSLLCSLLVLVLQRPPNITAPAMPSCIFSTNTFAFTLAITPSLQISNDILPCKLVY
jgi:hypothetical protein